MAEDEGSLLLDCPKCAIKITVRVSVCREGSKFCCPICSEEISFHFEGKELDELLERTRRQQEKDLRKSFPLTFGDL